MENHSQTKFLGDDHLHRRDAAHGSADGCNPDGPGMSGAHGYAGDSTRLQAQPGPSTGTPGALARVLVVLAAALLAASAQGCLDEPCTPAELGEPAPEGEAPLFAWWTPNAFPLTLVVDRSNGCPLETVREAAAFWEPHSGGFRVVEGRYRDGEDREYARVYLRRGRPACAVESCSGHTNLTAVAPGRAMYASITVDDRCDLAVITHELGHALGLDEAERAGAMMTPEEDRDGLDLAEGEIERLAYACDP
jgi:hypothetical protein